jgi:tRNA (cytidine/uridine-2'-O-)-methyltransferase
MRIALFEPDIPQNTGAILRLAACFDLGVDVIEPCGFVFSDRRLKRSGMDYMDELDLTRHSSWDAYEHSLDKLNTRILLLTTTGDTAYTAFDYDPNDTLLLGRESAGAPDHVHEAADARLIIPMATGRRSLNVAMAASMVVGEAVRQVGQQTG